MPSFDIVSKLDIQEIDNTVNTVTRDIANRYDFRGSDSAISLNKSEKYITITASNDMQLNAIRDMLENRAISRKISIKTFDYQKEENASGMSVRQKVVLKEGIGKELTKKINKLIKGAKLKVQPQIQGDQLRVTAKKIDDLQAVIQLTKEADLSTPLQFVNMKK